MRKGFGFESARGAALASLVWLCCPGLLPSAGGSAAPDGSPGPPEEVLALLEEFWDLAWGLDFTLTESAMSLHDSGVPGVWNVVVHAGPQTVAQGLYLEIERLAVPQLDAWTPRPIAVEHFVTAGLVVGQTGAQKAVYGLAQHLAYEDENGDETVVDAMVPVGMADGVGTALDAALAVLNQIATAHAVPAAGEPPYTPEDDPCGCDEIYDNELAACATTAVACQLACTAAALGALAGCLAAGPLAPVCMAAILTAQAVCIAGCLTNQNACNLRAFNAWLSCRHACEKAADDGPDAGP